MKEIYLDHAAATPIDKRVIDEMIPYLTEYFGNPGSFHSKGKEASDAIESAREKISKIINCYPNEIVFTASGTESINLALKGIAFSNKDFGNHIITSSIEHHAVLDTCKYLEKNGFSVTYLPVDKHGLVNPIDVKNAITQKTILISIMHANNEIGTIQPIEEIGKIAKENSIYFHSDACQTAGFLNLNLKETPVDLISINASKLYGPKGIGLLYIKKGTKINPLIHGGGQELGLRSGTENVSAIVGFAKALEISKEFSKEKSERLSNLRDYFISRLLEIPKTRLNGSIEKRLPNNVNISFLDIEGEAMLLYLNEYNIFASTGSACTSKNLETSHVLRAIGLPYEASHGSLRFTLGNSTTKEDLDNVAKIMPEIVSKLRSISPVKLNMEHYI